MKAAVNGGLVLLGTPRGNAHLPFNWTGTGFLATSSSDLYCRKVFQMHAVRHFMTFGR